MNSKLPPGFIQTLATFMVQPHPYKLPQEKVGSYGVRKLRKKRKLQKLARRQNR